MYSSLQFPFLGYGHEIGTRQLLHNVCQPIRILVPFHTETNFQCSSYRKSPEELALYQSTLAVDNRRSPLCIPGKEPTDELDLSKPLYVTAKMLSNRRRGKAGLGDTVSVYIPGPITIG